MADVWRMAANRIVKAGQMPFPVTDNLLAFLQEIMTEEQARFLKVFRRPTLTVEQIHAKTGRPEAEIRATLEALLERGVIVESQSRRTGVTVYTLMPVFPGLIEFSMMKGEHGPRAERLAALIEQILADFRDSTQAKYDHFMPQVKHFPAPARVVPVEEEITLESEVVIPAEDVDQLVEAQDVVALTHCYCRTERDLVGESCQVTDMRENCLIFGKVARHSVKYGFARFIDVAEAKQILRAAEDDGLVHKIFHTHLNPSKDIEGICSCCRCCCGIFRLFHEGAMPLHTLTAYLARVDDEACIGCGTCVERCPMDAITLEDDVAHVTEERCIGCGVCAHLCPADPKAITMEKTGRREIFVLPPRLQAGAGEA